MVLCDILLQKQLLTYMIQKYHTTIKCHWLLTIQPRYIHVKLSISRHHPSNSKESVLSKQLPNYSLILVSISEPRETPTDGLVLSHQSARLFYSWTRYAQMDFISIFQNSSVRDVVWKSRIWKRAHRRLVPLKWINQLDCSKSLQLICV